MRSERSAGGVVIRQDETEGIQVLVIKDSHGRWSFPKGRIEVGETAQAAAEREVNEEVGIETLRLIAPLGVSDFWFVDKWEAPGEKVHKTIELFLFETSPGSHGMAQEEERIQRVHWVRPKELRGLVAYRTLKPIIERAITLLHEPQR
ncbi:NUDIX domain-containing protein [Candidatus Berkelbacteria bacterium]|nr:NUDIX domain-containing protein [Candidatus Berkelbacteria bacterium]